MKPRLMLLVCFTGLLFTMRTPAARHRPKPERNRACHHAPGQDNRRIARHAEDGHQEIPAR